MGHVRDEIRAQRLRAGELLGHAVEAVRDLVQPVVAVQARRRRDAHGEIPLHELLRRVKNPPHGLVDQMVAAHAVKQRQRAGEREHIDQRDSGSVPDVRLCQRKLHFPGHAGEEQQHAAGDQEPRQRKEDHIAAHGEEHAAHPFLVPLHLITAL